jgi:nicotinamide-nucleotide amidase
MYPIEEIDQIKNYMLERQQTVAVAESVTSGHLQAALSLATQASLFFQGGITTYNLGQKARHLHINPVHAASCNCVSVTVAREMAIRVCSLFSSDWSLAITGYAAPVPELNINKLFAFYAFAFRNTVVAEGKLESEDKGTGRVQASYAAEVLKKFSGHLMQSTIQATSGV